MDRLKQYSQKQKNEIMDKYLKYLQKYDEDNPEVTVKMFQQKSQKKIHRRQAVGNPNDFIKNVKMAQRMA